MIPIIDLRQLDLRHLMSGQITQAIIPYQEEMYNQIRLDRKVEIQHTGYYIGTMDIQRICQLCFYPNVQRVPFYPALNRYASRDEAKLLAKESGFIGVSLLYSHLSRTFGTAQQDFMAIRWRGK